MRVLFLSLMACSSSPPETGSTEPTDTATTPTGGPTGPTGPDCDGSEQASGTAVDRAGAPIADADIRFCQGPICAPATTDDAGHWCIGEAPAGWHALEIRPPEGSGLAIGHVPVQYAGGETREFTFVLPPLELAQTPPSTPAELEVAPGIFATVGAGQLEPPLFVDPSDTVSGARLDPTEFPAIDLPGEPVAVWFLDPFDHHADPGLPVRFANDLGLADATELEVWIGSYEAQAWVPAGSVTASGAWLEGDATLPVFATVALIRP